MDDRVDRLKLSALGARLAKRVVTQRLGMLQGEPVPQLHGYGIEEIVGDDRFRAQANRTGLPRRFLG